MKRMPGILWLPFGFGAIFTTLFVVSFVEYFWGDGDEGRFAVCGVAAIFTTPMLVGSILIMYRKPAGLSWLRVGSLLFLLHPEHFLKIWQIDGDPNYIAWMTGMLPVAKPIQGRSVTGSKRPWLTSPSPRADSSPSQDPQSTT